jgi:mannose-1-phosphate guanylyltransferase/phosphomannomutase
MTATTKSPATALVLAAGASTRIRTAAGQIPKPLIRLTAETILEMNLRNLASASVRRVWINLNYKGDLIEQVIGDGARYGVQVRYSREATLMGTAGAAKRLQRELSEGTFFVVYGDNLSDLDLGALSALHRARSAAATITVFDERTATHSGIAGGRIVLEPDGRISRIDEGSGTSHYVNAGAYVLEPEILDAVPADAPSDFAREVFPSVIASGSRVYAYVHTGYCPAVDTPVALERARALAKRIDAGGHLLP